MGKAGPASSRHRKPPAVSSLTSRCSPWCPMCSTSQLSTPAVSAAASCPLSQSTSVSRGRGGGVEGPPPSSYSSTTTGSPPSCQDEILSIHTDSVGSTFTVDQESAHFSPSGAPAWSRLHHRPPGPRGRSGSFPHSRPHIHLCFLRQPREGTCEHYSQVSLLHCSQPSRAPTFLRVKAQVLLMAHSALHGLPHPLPVLPSSPSPLCSLCSIHTGLLTVPPACQAQSCPRALAHAVLSV